MKYDNLFIHRVENGWVMEDLDTRTARIEGSYIGISRPARVYNDINVLLEDLGDLLMKSVPKEKPPDLDRCPNGQPHKWLWQHSGEQRCNNCGLLKLTSTPELPDPIKCPSGLNHKWVKDKDKNSCVCAYCGCLI